MNDSTIPKTTLMDPSVLRLWLEANEVLIAIACDMQHPDILAGKYMPTMESIDQLPSWQVRPKTTMSRQVFRGKVIKAMYIAQQVHKYGFDINRPPRIRNGRVYDGETRIAYLLARGMPCMVRLLPDLPSSQFQNVSI